MKHWIRTGAVLFSLSAVTLAATEEKSPFDPVDAAVVFRAPLVCGEAITRLRDESVVVRCGERPGERVRAFALLVTGRPSVDATLVRLRKRRDVESAERASPPMPLEPVR